jgi:hypothetical protein
MDPMGFALENFDAIGLWRTTAESGEALDVSAVMPNGKHFEGPSGLRALLVAHKEQFVTILTEKLLAYALGRPLEYYDHPAVRQIVTRTAAANYKWSAIIEGIADSAPFQYRVANAKRAAH